MAAPQHPLALWHDYIKNNNKDALHQVIDENCVFHSPVVHTPQVGKAITLKYLKAAASILKQADFKYTNEWVTENGAVLEFECTLDGIFLNGVDMILWNNEKRITSFKVMARPLKGINILHQKMGEMLTKTI